MVQGLWEPSALEQMIRTIQAMLDDLHEGRSFCGKPGKVYFVHVKNHPDDANASVSTDINMLGNIRADILVRWGKSVGPYSRLCDGGEEGDGVNGPCRDGRLNGKKLVDRTATRATNSRENMVDRDGFAMDA
jgi:hypothetical protein